jgi:hypothetical protein
MLDPAATAGRDVTVTPNKKDSAMINANSIFLFPLTFIIYVHTVIFDSIQKRPSRQAARHDLDAVVRLRRSFSIKNHDDVARLHGPNVIIVIVDLVIFGK